MPNLIRYGFFSLPAAISLLTMQVYMPAFLAEQPAFSFSMIGVIFFGARLVDTVSDPLIGYFSDRTNLLIGKRRAWLFITAPIFIVVFYELLKSNETPAYLFLLVSIWYIGGTGLLVPYYAWGAEIENGYKAHNRYTAARVIFGLLGTVTALALPALTVGTQNSLATISLNVNIVAASMVIALLFMITLPDKPGTNQVNSSFLSVFKVFKRKSHFNRLMISQFFNATANAIPATLFILFSTHVLKRADLAGPILIIYFLMAALSIPIWTRMSLRWSKESCWRSAMILASIVFMATIFVGENTIWVFIVITFITGFMAGADLCLPGSMLADLVELDKHAHGKSRSGVYFAFWGTLSKFCLALAIGITFPILDLGIMVQDASNAPINTDLLLYMYGFMPAVLKLISVRLFWAYKLSDVEKLTLAKK